MDVHHELNGVRFVWHREKARLNAARHDGISFQQAAEVFFDPFLVVEDASRNDEARDAAIGVDASGKALYVVHIEFEGSCIRIISARKATAQERQRHDF